MHDFWKNLTFLFCFTTTVQLMTWMFSSRVNYIWFIIFWFRWFTMLFTWDNGLSKCNVEEKYIPKKIQRRIADISVALQSLPSFLSALYLFKYTQRVWFEASLLEGESEKSMHQFIIHGIFVMLISHLSWLLIPPITIVARFWSDASTTNQELFYGGVLWLLYGLPYPHYNGYPYIRPITFQSAFLGAMIILLHTTYTLLWDPNTFIGMPSVILISLTLFGLTPYFLFCFKDIFRE